MFRFLKRTKLKRENLKWMAELMYKDVSDAAWDKENLTKMNLDFTIDSLRYIDQYAKKSNEY